jgi:hypothetical protein
MSNSGGQSLLTGQGRISRSSSSGKRPAATASDPRPLARARQRSATSALPISPNRWWSLSGSNRRPQACKASALPTELRPRSSATLTPQVMVGRVGVEPTTSRLSGVRSNHLSYRPMRRRGPEIAKLFLPRDKHGRRARGARPTTRALPAARLAAALARPSVAAKPRLMGAALPRWPSLSTCERARALSSRRLRFSSDEGT